MDIRIDAAAGLIDAEDARFPLTLDCRDGTARLHCGEAVFVLRPMRWREKANLARFAHLGAAFLDEAFLRLSLIGDPPLPDDARARQALSHLAEWINAPGRERPLPLDPLLLARAAAALCRGLGLRPQDLDDLPADEVEALWAALDIREERESPPGRRRTTAGFTHRIEIVPDRIDANQTPADRAPLPSRAAADCMPASVSPPDHPAPAAGPRAGRPHAPARSSVATRAGPTADRPARPVPEMNCEAGGPPDLPSPANCSTSGPRFRVVTSPSPAAGKTSASLPEAGPSSQASLPQMSLSPMPPPSQPIRGNAMPATMAPPGAANPALSRPEALAHAPSTAPAAMTTMAADVESLLDAFAERLAEAATLLGIDEV